MFLKLVIITIAAFFTLAHSDCNSNVLDQSLCCRKTFNPNVTAQVQSFLDGCNSNASFTGSAESDCQELICQYQCTAIAFQAVSILYYNLKAIKTKLTFLLSFYRQTHVIIY